VEVPSPSLAIHNPAAFAFVMQTHHPISATPIRQAFVSFPHLVINARFRNTIHGSAYKQTIIRPNKPE
jgi:hypothetical protein